MAPPNSLLTLQQKRRRRRRSLVIISSYVLIAFALAWYFESQATTTVLFVRHADVDDPAHLADDPPLNAAGRARAELLARFLQDVDVVAGVDAIYASDARRARQTAEPLAERLGVDIGSAAEHEPEPFMDRVQHDHKGEIVLVVSDADAIAPMIEELHGSKNVPEMAPDEYDNFYIVSVPWSAKVKTLRLRYGLGWEPPEDVRTSHGSDR